MTNTPPPPGPAMAYGAPMSGEAQAVNTAPSIFQTPSHTQPVPQTSTGTSFSQPAVAYGASGKVGNMPMGPATATGSGAGSGIEPEVHTMPEKFLPQVTVKKHMGPIKKFVLVGGVIVGVMIIITAVVVLIFSRQQTQVNNQNENSNTNGAQAVKINQNVNAANLNTNVNSIVNTNTNTNLNTNTLVNSTANPNSNANVGVNTNTATNTNTALSHQPLPATKDSDKDGLTDNEETTWGSSQSKPDTDGDGFLDGAELAHGYSPTGPETLAQDPNAKSYSNTTYGYTILYPSRWVEGQLDASDVDILFTAETGEFVEVTVTSNPKQQTAKQWYLEQFPDLQGKELITFTANGLTGVKSLDGLTGYIANGTTLYLITYNVGTRQAANFLVTFDMMLSTFAITPNETSTGNSNNNTNTNQ